MCVRANLLFPPRRRATTAVCLAVAAATPALATTTITYPFRGVTHYQRVEPAGAVVPRKVVMHILEIDLTDPTISMILTPSNGAAPGEVNGQTTREFVTDQNAQIGVNLNLWSPVSTGPNGENYRDVNAIAAAAGQQVSNWEAGGWPLMGAINFSSTMFPTPVTAPSGSSTSFTTVPSITKYNLVGSRYRMIWGGVITDPAAYPPSPDPSLSTNPRTCIGLKGTSTMYLFEVDGRQTASGGMTLPEVANFMSSEYGLTYLLNLDGGGSSTLVFADPIPRVLNTPSDGSERSVANNIALKATQMQEWKTNGNGDWSTAANWSSAVPNAAGSAARFGAAISAPRTVTLTAPATAGLLLFDNTNAYTVAGSQPLTLDATAGNAVIKVLSGSHTISTPLTLLDHTDINIAANAALTLSGNLSASAITLTKQGAGTLQLPNIRSAGLTISAGILRISPSGNGDTHTNASTSRVTSSFTLAPGASLDLTNNLIALPGGANPTTTLNSVRNLLIAARNVPVGGVGDGKWNGNGITSSTAAAHFISAGLEERVVAYALNSALPLCAYSTFGGQSVSLTDILVRYTKNGDADLDGKCGDSDVTVVGAFYDNGATTTNQWCNGDFNFDGRVDDSDVTLLGAFYDEFTTPLSPADLTADAEFAAAFEAGRAIPVPEPAALTLLGILALTLPNRRRRETHCEH